MLNLSLKNLKCKSCQTLGSTVYHIVSDEILENNKLFKISNLYSRGQTLVSYNNPYVGVFCLHSGKLKATYRNNDGTENLIMAFDPGAIIGMKDFSKRFYDFCLVALEDSIVCFYDKKYFSHLIDTDKTLKNLFLERCFF